MCLKQAKVITLDEDKVVYKVFIKDVDGALITLYQGKIYKLSDEPIHDDYSGDDVKRNRININGHIVNGNKMNDGYEVNGGMFHSFAYYEDAVVEATKHNVYWFYGADVEVVVVKCIIPKHAQLVMEGVFHSDSEFFVKSYASSDIIFKEIVWL